MVYDVVITGGGAPVGLFLACELHLAGTAVLVLEQVEDPCTPIIIRDLIETGVATAYFAKKISGVWLRYNLPGDHALIGRSAPDFQFEDGTRLGDHLHDGSALLLDLEDSETLRALSQPWSGKLKYVSAKAKDRLGLSALLVRPDGFIAWAAEGDPGLAGASAARKYWFGHG